MLDMTELSSKHIEDFVQCCSQSLLASAQKYQIECWKGSLCYEREFIKHAIFYCLAGRGSTVQNDGILFYLSPLPLTISDTCLREFYKQREE